MNEPEHVAAGSPGVMPICLLAAVMEGLDLQSMGVAAPRLAPALHLLPPGMGLALSASTVGLMAGAAIGGRLADRLGYRIVLVVSLLALGVFSFATTFAWGLPSLIAARVLAGLGIGGVFPCLIALVSAATAPPRRASALGIMYAGLPVGGAIAGATAAWLGASPDWRAIFYLGAVGPVVLAPFAWAKLHRLTTRRSASPAPTGPAPTATLAALLFRERTGATLLLWTAYFFTLFVVYLLLNWLPSLLVARGFSKPAALAASLVYNAGAIVGSVMLGRWVDRGRLTLPILISYGGITAALAGLAVLTGPAIYLGALLAGVFASGGQLMLYALAPTYYPAADRGAGVGSAVAVGRIGSILGPVLAGVLIGALGAGGVLIAAVPGLAIACAATLLLVRRPPDRQR